MVFSNAYGDTRRAVAYSRLAFPGTYYLAFRDLLSIIRRHAGGKRALDFGCGTGRSTRFLKSLGFEVLGIDIAAEMLALARQEDPRGDYLLVEDGDIGQLPQHTFDLVLSSFTFDNIPTMERKATLFEQLGRLLVAGGAIVNLVSSPEMYTHEWVSFSTKDFPQNRIAEDGDKVKIIITAVDDERPVEDILWSDRAYQQTYRRAGLKRVAVYRPLATEGEHCDWVNETTVAPWVIYVLKPLGS
jgi:SAM-dependent methyltransferase